MFRKRPAECVGRYGRRKRKLPMPAAPIREMGVVWAAGKAEIVVNAHLGCATSIPIRWGAGRPRDGDEAAIEPAEDPRRAPQRIYTYWSLVEEKSQTL